MLLYKSFAVSVEPVVKPAEVITNQKPFFDPGASTSNLAESVEPSEPWPGLCKIFLKGFSSVWRTLPLHAGTVT